MCNEVCGPGTQISRHHHMVAAEHGGGACEGDEERSRTCELTPCPIDCAWAEWTDWGACDEACGAGFQTKSRYMETHAQYDGVPCEGAYVEEQGCNNGECPVDCVVSKWLTTGECTKLCGSGTQRQQREIEVHGEHGGSSCPTDLTRDVPCNTEPCAIDCVVSAWVNDGSCSASCGGGVQHQVKNIETRPQHGGAPCAAVMEQFIGCSDEACPVDCVWGPWSGWSACDAACGEGKQRRSRFIKVNADFAGLECEGPFEEEQGCQLVACPVDAVWDQWQEWAPCDEACGPGWHTRVRSMEVEAQFGGRPAEGPSFEMQGCQAKPCPVDCVVSAWKTEGTCSVSCGGGDQKEERTIKQEALHGGFSCPTDLERTVACNENPCPVDCVLSAWTRNGECSVSCGGGNREEVRTVITPTADGGRGCDAPLSRNKPCGDVPCPVDCVWGQWSRFGDCTKTCGDGERTRRRDLASHAEHGGAECDGEKEENESCGNPCPVHCELGEWTSWSECSEACGEGIKERTRAESQPAEHGGEQCEGDLIKTEPCTKDPCAVDCDITDWVEVVSCSLSCGGGLRQEERTINQQALFGGEDCPADLVRDLPCNIEPCPVDCVMSAWEQKDGCSVTCGGGVYTEEILVLTHMAHEGVACPAEPWERHIDCNTHPCPIDCAFGLWTGWSTCSHTCGGGLGSRLRVIEVEADHGGKDCIGALEEEQPCNPFFCPIDCVWGGWSDWGDCSEACGPGLSERSRDVTTSAAYGGAACQGVPHEERDCEIVPCPIDCVVTPWNAISTCSTSCDLGKRTEGRTITVASAHGGIVCPETLSREVDCSAVPCPVDCVLSEWLDDGECTVTCGGAGGVGLQHQIKQIDTAPLHGGVECDPAQSQHIACNTHECPVDCEMSPWSDWGQCSVSCATGQKIHTRTVARHPAYGGVVCPTDLEGSTSCVDIQHCPIDCVMEDWSAWGACSQDCGPGIQLRDRGVQVSPDHGGATCHPEREQQMNCFLMHCPVDCEVTEWSDEGSCSKSCGVGQQKQVRSVSVAALHGGEECPGLSQYVDCNTQACPIDCVMSGWEDDGACSLTCGGGLMPQRREVETQPAFGGVACPVDDASGAVHVTKTRDCEEHDCPIDCVWGDWGAWGTCSLTCGNGEKTATRSHAVEAQHGGAACSGSETKATHCNPNACPIDCVVGEWTAWGDCSTSCADGTQDRSRSVTVPPQHGGRVCEALSATQACNLRACPIHCEITPAWVASGDCTVSCGGGWMPHSRTILVPPAHGGSACPSVARDFPCNQHECPVDCIVSDWADDGTCSEPCGGGELQQRRYVQQQVAFGGAACVTDMTQIIDCNTQLCPTMPIGEHGIATHTILQTGSEGGATTFSTYTMNAQFNKPIVFAGAPSNSAASVISGVKMMGVTTPLPTCPLQLTTPMSQGNLLALTFKESANDECLGVSGANECHDDNSDGGDILGYIFHEPIAGRESDFIELERAFSWNEEDTCVGNVDDNECHSTDMKEIIGYVFKKDVPITRRPNTVMLTRKRVTNRCMNLKQFLFTKGSIQKNDQSTDDELAALARTLIMETLGFPPPVLSRMNGVELHEIIMRDATLFGVKCDGIIDTCTQLEGHNDCRMPDGENTAEEQVGWIIAADAATEEPMGDWLNCAVEVACPIEYAVATPAQIEIATVKEVNEGEATIICGGIEGENVCGGTASGTGGAVLGGVFKEALTGEPMRLLTKGDLGDNRAGEKDKSVGHVFTEWRQGLQQAYYTYGSMHLCRGPAGTDAEIESAGSLFAEGYPKAQGNKFSEAECREKCNNDAGCTAFIMEFNGMCRHYGHTPVVGKLAAGADIARGQCMMKVVNAYFVAEDFVTHYSECGKFDAASKKWGFSMKVDFGKDVANEEELYVPWMAFDAGVYETAGTEDNTVHHKFQVGKVTCGGGEEWTDVKFHEEFATDPIILTQMQTYNNGKLARTRVKQASTDKKTFKIGVETKDGTTGNKQELCGWMAIEKSEGIIGGLRYIAKVEDALDHEKPTAKSSDEDASQPFPDDYFLSAPGVFASIMTTHDSASAHVIDVTTAAGHTMLRIENDDFTDSSHGSEEVAVFALQSESFQAAVMNGWLERKVTFAYHAGSWGDCNVVCGEGKRTREVSCRRGAASTESYGDQYCEGEKLSTEETCGSECAYHTTDWAQCPALGSMEEKTREISCNLGAHGEGAGVANSDCEGAGITAPATSQACCNPKAASDFADLHCGSVSNGCSDNFAGDVAIGSCGGAQWNCNSNKCECEERDVYSENPVAEGYVNEFNQAINFMCPSGTAMLGVASQHSDMLEDRRWRFTCGAPAAPMRLGTCESKKLCGHQEEWDLTCPDGHVFAGISATVPVNHDRQFEFQCCKLEGYAHQAVEELETGESATLNRDTQAVFSWSPGLASMGAWKSVGIGEPGPMDRCQDLSLLPEGAASSQDCQTFCKFNAPCNTVTWKSGTGCHAYHCAAEPAQLTSPAAGMTWYWEPPLAKVPAEAAKFMNGVKTSFNNAQVDRIFKWKWASYKTQAHCESCSSASLSFTAPPFGSGKDNEYAGDLDEGGQGKVLVGVKSRYRDDRKDSKWLLKFGEVLPALKWLATEPEVGSLEVCQGDCDNDDECPGASKCVQRTNGQPAVVEGCSAGDSASSTRDKTDYCSNPPKQQAAWTDCAPMEPVSCAADVERTAGWTPSLTSWSFECPRDHVVTHVKSKWLAAKLDREYQFECCKVPEASGYAEKSVPSEEFGHNNIWKFDGGSRAVDAVESFFVPGGQRRFKFYSSTFQGTKTCSTEWSR